MSLHSVDPDSFNCDLATDRQTSICPVTHCANCQRRSYLAVWTIATRFCTEWPITSRGKYSRCRMPQHASSPEPDVVTTLRRCCVSCTGFQFGTEWTSNSPVWWLMISVSSLKATDGPSGLHLTTYARCHVRTTASETEALELPVREFGTVCHVVCEHLTWVTNILKYYCRHVWLGHGDLWHLYIYILYLLTYLLLRTRLSAQRLGYSDRILSVAL